jgi:thiol-disulfide isomerase/thioredoxin
MGHQQIHSQSKAIVTLILRRLAMSVFALTAAQKPLFAEATFESLPSKPYKLLPLTKDAKSKTQKDFDNSGHITVIDFWASWCQSCKTNLAKLEPLAQKLKRKSLSHEIIAVSVDESKSDALDYLERESKQTPLLKGKMLWDSNQKLSNQLNFEGVPYLLVVDQKGSVILKHDGPLTKKDLRKLEKILKLEDDHYAQK